MESRLWRNFKKFLRWHERELSPLKTMAPMALAARQSLYWYPLSSIEEDGPLKLSKNPDVLSILSAIYRLRYRKHTEVSNHKKLL